MSTQSSYKSKKHIIHLSFIITKYFVIEFHVLKKNENANKTDT